MQGAEPLQPIALTNAPAMSLIPDDPAYAVPCAAMTSDAMTSDMVMSDTAARQSARLCRNSSTTRNGHHGVVCSVLVVVTLDDDGCGMDVVVVVRSVDDVCVDGLDPQAASSAVPPSNVAANNS
jgi:hypothetical protein